jgi:adenylate cyclase
VTFALFVAVTRARRTLTGPLTEAHLRSNLSRYFSPQLVEEIANAGAAVPSFQPQRAAILFVDLRGFTSMAGRCRSSLSEMPMRARPAKCRRPY